MCMAAGNFLCIGALAQDFRGIFWRDYCNPRYFLVQYNKSTIVREDL